MTFLLEVENLKKYFPIRGGILSKQIAAVHAVDGISFAIKKGETYGLVGESGCGKTTVGRCILKLIEPEADKLVFMGSDLFKLGKHEIKLLRREMAMIFQDPYSSLNPRFTVADIIGEPLQVHRLAKGNERLRKVMDLMEKVGLAPDHIYRYPHEFSGGQKQRIGIARALVLSPKLIVADEPVSALDVSVRASIINLLMKLQKELGLTYLFITHDLSVVKHICDRVAIMYVGKLVEIASTETIFSNPQHPYTQALISAIPIPDPSIKTKHIILKGDIPSPINPPSGCHFYERCFCSNPKCKGQEPVLVEVEREHYVACHSVC